MFDSESMKIIDARFASRSEKASEEDNQLYTHSVQTTKGCEAGMLLVDTILHDSVLSADVLNLSNATAKKILVDGRIVSNNVRKATEIKGIE